MSSEPVTLMPPLSSCGERMTREAGLLAGRLLHLLDQVLPEAGDTPSTIGFLRAMHAAADPSFPSGPADHPLDRLVRAFDLSPVEVDLVVLAGLPEEHEGYASILRTLNPRGEPRPTAGLAAQLFCADAEERRALRGVLTTGAAVRGGILRIEGDAPFFERTLNLAEELWPVLHGLDCWPALLAPIPGPGSIPGFRDWLSGDGRAGVAAVVAGEPRTILVTAPTEDAAFALGTALVGAAGAEPVRLLLRPGSPVELERLASVHCVARGCVPVVRLARGEGPGAPEAPHFAEHPGPVVVCARPRELALRGDRLLVEIAVESIAAADRKDMWRHALAELGTAAPLLAARYTTDPDSTLLAARDARSLARLEARETSLTDIGRAIRSRTGATSSPGLQLIRPAAGWDQIVLPPQRADQLQEAVGRLLHQERVLDHWRFLAGRRGARGVRMLFAGPSGTGKTLAAEVMARALGLDLLLVDISRVVSKWIGETEKNLSSVFDAAERSQAVLLFDEADALFGRRTEVSDAHDRYANLETAYLLSRLERFEGLAILSTNLRQNIDPAFIRRLEFVVEFEEPGPVERTALWRCHFPPSAPIAEDVDLRELASLYPVVGGFIRNAAVAAAFLAAADGSPITRSHVVRAIRREYDKSGRAFPGYPAGMAPS